MSTLVRAAPPAHYAWLCRKSGYTPGLDFRAIEAIDESGTIHGMVGFDGWTPNAVHMHVALETPARCRELVRAAFRYPFEQALRGVVLGFTPGNHIAALGLAKRLGFREVHSIPDGWDVGVPLVVFEMRAAECRWLSLKQKAA